MPSIPTTPIPGLSGARGIFFDYGNYVLITNNEGYWMVDKKTLAEDVINACSGKQTRVETTASVTEKAIPPPKPESLIKVPKPETQPPPEVRVVSGTRDQETQTDSIDASVSEKLKRLEENKEVTGNWDITRDDYGTWYFPKHFLAEKSGAKGEASGRDTISSRSGKSDSTSYRQIDPAVTKDRTVTQDDFGTPYFPKDFLPDRSRAEHRTYRETMSRRDTTSDSSNRGQVEHSQPTPKDKDQFIIYWRIGDQFMPVGVLTARLESLAEVGQKVITGRNERIKIVTVNPHNDQHLRIVNDISKSSNAFTLSIGANSSARVALYDMTGIGYIVSGDSTLIFNSKVLTYGDSGQKITIDENKCELNQSTTILCIFVENEIHLVHIGQHVNIHIYSVA